MERFTAMWQIQNNIYENIKFADSKAIALGVINAAVLGGLNALGVFTIDVDILLLIPALLSFLSLLISFIYIVKVIKPRGKSNLNNPDISHINPALLCNIPGQDYSEKLKNIQEDELIEELAIMIKQRAEINNKKYDALEFVIYFAVSGWLFALLTAVTTGLFA